MLRTVPRNWFTWNCEVIKNDISIAGIQFAAWTNTGELIVEGDCYRVYRESAFSGNFFLEKDGNRLIKAVKPSPFRVFRVYYAGREYELKAESSWKRIFLLLSQGETIGVIRPEHAWTRRALVDLPENFPLVIRLFMVWLVLLSWKQEWNATSAVSAGGAT
ncbi:MAG: hypothetical protein IGS49_29670 [Chlorogloeopsis fritschii C42_A2020_084]|uniref:hypothetical protein n=1 Tax=Chlorogloeopsis fritschii TaxID=1124 RepID=UPI0019D9994B|nr:hypothetical protein [Chlorogloeopsis fritschii]MBF2009480.1 hypothetical protein [Chlorogloeopsis fritschii C42_A2020_084]